MKNQEAIQKILKNYAHDYRNTEMSIELLSSMLQSFLCEITEEKDGNPQGISIDKFEIVSFLSSRLAQIKDIGKEDLGRIDELIFLINHFLQKKYE